ncbi:MAG TPA: helix-turn-helix transcriptional regulator, partial [Myxococcales bacterium]|nr:helix-turn-helix transcriptional regulator [Myxococcales bacterium]
MPRLETGLRRARQKSGLTQGELAARAGISRQTLSILESGRSHPSTVVALSLANVLRCRVEELFWLREEGGELRTEIAGPRERRDGGSRRALLGSVAGRWVAHPLRRRDPLGLTTAADALIVRAGRDGQPARVAALRPLESLQANVLLIGCDPGLGVLAGRVADRWPGLRLCWIG